MVPGRSAPQGWLDERGVSWVTVLLLLCLAAGGYLAWTWGPVYLVHYQAKQVVRDFTNQAVKNAEDAVQREVMTRRLAMLDHLEVVDEYGRTVRVPVVNVRPEAVIWERTQNPPTIRIAFEYTRVVRYPLIDRETQATFAVDHTLDTTRPEWGGR